MTFTFSFGVLIRFHDVCACLNTSIQNSGEFREGFTVLCSPRTKRPSHHVKHLFFLFIFIYLLLLILLLQPYFGFNVNDHLWIRLSCSYIHFNKSLLFLNTLPLLIHSSWGLLSILPIHWYPKKSFEKQLRGLLGCGVVHR